MAYDRETLRITDGMDVLGSDNEKVGTVAGMRGDYVVVSKGFFFPTDYYIPTSAITSTSEDHVYLSVTKDEALNQRWDVEPADTGVVSQEQPIIDPGLHLDNPVPADRLPDDQFSDEPAEPFDHHADVDHRDQSDTITVPVTEEELAATTRGVDRGSVQVDKVITEEQQTLDVPVTEERVTIDRRVVDRDVAPGDATFEEGTIEVPLHGQEVEVEKRARVREEIEIGKEQVTSSERVTDTVRREDVRISSDTDTVIDDTDTIDGNDRPLR